MTDHLLAIALFAIAAFSSLGIAFFAMTVPAAPVHRVRVLSGALAAVLAVVVAVVVASGVQLWAA
jgi:hypothetical protein